MPHSDSVSGKKLVVGGSIDATPFNRTQTLDALRLSRPWLRQLGKAKEGDGIRCLQSDGVTRPRKADGRGFAEVAEQTRLADELGYAIAWFDAGDVEWHRPLAAGVDKADNGGRRTD
jgi:hypothetical protein